MIHYIFGRAGYGKSEYLYAKLKDMLDRNVRNILFVIPEQQTVLTERKLFEIFGNRLNLNAEIINFSRFKNFITRRLGGMNNNYIDDIVKKFVMRKSVKSLAPLLKEYGSKADSFDFTIRMTNIVNELKSFLITPQMLSEAAEKMADSENKDFLGKLNDINLIYSLYSSSIGKDLCDIADDFVYLNDLLKKDGTKFFSGYTVFFDSFDYFSAGQKLLLNHIFKDAEDVFITFKISDEKMFNARERNVFYKTIETKQYIDTIINEYSLPSAPPVYLDSSKKFSSDSLTLLEKNIFKDEEESNEHPAKTNDVHMIKCADLNDEVEYTAKAIIKLMRENGYKYREIQVISKDISRYHGIIDVIFEKYGIKYFMSAPSQFMSKPAVAFLLSAVDIILYNFKTEHVLQHLKTGFSVLTGDEIDIFEIYITNWEINGYYRYDDKYWQMHPDGYIEYDEDDAELVSFIERINDIKDRFFLPFRNLKIKLQNKKDNLTVRDILTFIIDFFTETDVFGKLNSLCGKYREEGNTAESDECAQIWNILMDIFNKMNVASSSAEGNSSSAEGNGGSDGCDLKSFRDMLEFILGEQEIENIPTSIDEVLIDNSENMRSMDIKATFILGMNADIFPAPVADDDIFNDAEKEILGSYGIEYKISSLFKIYDEYYDFYNAVTSAGEKLFFTYAGFDSNGDELYRSDFLDMIENIFPDIDTFIYNFEQTIQSPELPSDDDVYFYFEGENLKYEYRNIVNDKNIIFAFDEYFGEDDEYQRKIKEIGSAAPLKAGDDEIQKEMSERLFANLAMSPSSLESFAKCRFSYFVRHVLRLKTNRKEDFSALDFGNFTHKILELFFENIISDNIPLQYADKKYIQNALDVLIDNYLLNILIDFEFKSERFRYLFKRLKKDLTELILNIKNELEHSKFVPKKFELSIGGKRSGSVEPVEIQTSDHGKLVITGKVDRVDIYNMDGKTFIRIVDYKTGAKKFDFSEVAAGLNIQMLIYLFTLWHKGKDILSSADGNIADGEEIIPSGITYISSSSASGHFDGEVTDEEIEKKKRELFPRSGLYIDDAEIVMAMNDELDVKNSASNVFASFERIGKLEKHIEKILFDIAGTIAAGNANVNPLTKNGKLDSCIYCDYKAVCKIEEDDYINSRTVQKLSPDEVWALIEGEKDDE